MSRKLVKALVSLAAMATLALSAPSVAGASQASISGSNLFFFAAAGETNDVAVAFDGTDYVVTDPGAPITPMAGCAAVNANQVTCTGAGVRRVDVRLGDMNDRGAIAASVVIPGDPFDTGVEMRGEAGNDDLIGGPNVNNHLWGHVPFAEGPGNDTLTGGNLADQLEGSDGNDLVQAGDGNDNLEGGNGDDQVEAGPGADTVDEGDSPNGTDQLNGGTGLDTISYSNRTGDVSLSLNGIADDGEPGEGDNVADQFFSIRTGDGNDTVTGSDGNSDVFTDQGDDTIEGGGGTDRISAADGEDTVNAGGGPDQINGGRDDDQLNGGDGDDVLIDDDEGAGGSILFSGVAGAGDDQFSGGAGTDELVYYTTRPLTVSLDGNADDGRPGEADNAGPDLENVNGGPADDLLVGNGSANRIDGGAGDDQIEGKGGPDGLAGGPGGDEIDGGNGVDSIEGEGGVDAIRSRDSKPDQVGCGSASDTLIADSRDDFSVTCDSSSTGPRMKSANARLNSKGRAKVKVTCPVAEGIACKVKLKVKKGKKTVAKGSGEVKSGKSGKVGLKLTGKGRKLNGKKIKGEATTRMTDAAGAAVTTSRKLVLKR